MVAMEPDIPAAPSKEEEEVQPIEPAVDLGCDKPDRVLSQPQITKFLVRVQDNVPRTETEPRAERMEAEVRTEAETERSPIADPAKADTIEGGGQHTTGRLWRRQEMN